MRMRELQTIRYDERTATLRFSGLNAFKKPKTVRVVIDDPEAFLNAIKKALSDPDGIPISFETSPAGQAQR
ncbi:hypothetical protein [Phyllobacterium endophyticum]|uniref:Uncharacterized protein n=1 Tax=Phyllobacterium endophyticum TaxID=1149773 RepID=A0A2P7AUV0_9HYPH|nr:hypothetical protein [Phyllobacterium endophyticum]MBB3234461.1 ribulose bisphosphate carboxylase small subunit [Phyllobacterium endophyticum]PSH57967.1 hypothetical protein CU100_09825 [Phyllobacterium endophyticum]TYR44175.1 hypothetical protein FY050_03175 [Phyllobacterium endophyticum]